MKIDRQKLSIYFFIEHDIIMKEQYINILS